MMSWAAARGFATSCARVVNAMCWGCPVTRRCATWRRHGPRIKGGAVAPRPCTIKEESRSGRIELDLGDPLARSAPQGLHLECRHGTCTRARETVGYLWEEVALRAPVQGRVTPTGDHQRETFLREMRQSYGPYRADRHASRTRGSADAVRVVRG